MGEFPVLETKRLSLIEIHHGHAQPLFSILSLQKVTEYYGMERLQEQKETAAMIDSFAAMFEQQRGIRWGIVWKDTGEFIGTIGLNHLFLHGKRAEIGFEIHPDFWDKGIVTEAAAEVIQYAYTTFALYRIGAVTFPANNASKRVLEKLGFQQEGLLRGYIRQAGENHDAVIFSLLRPEWKKMYEKEEHEIDERLQYTDHLTEIIRHAEKQGDFDNLPGKGKPLRLKQSYFANPYEKQLHKTMKDNHLLPHWVKLGKEIDLEKEVLATLKGKEYTKKMKQINKKIKVYNFACPPSLQRNKLSE